MEQQAFPDLLSVDQWGDLQSADDLVVLDASWAWEGDGPRRGHRETRIPGARLFDHGAAQDPQSPLHDTVPSAELFAQHASRLGIPNQDRIVLYSQGAFSGAARAWFLFRLFGHHKVSVLDGGLTAYVEAGLPVESGQPTTVPATAFKAATNSGLLVDVPGMQGALDNQVQTIDGRPHAVYLGEQDFFAEQGGPAQGKPGRIADMPNIATSEVTTDGELKSVADLCRLFSHHGIDLAEPIVTTCSLGVGASGIAFALHLAGARQVSLFDGSYEAWVSR